MQAFFDTFFSVLGTIIIGALALGAIALVVLFFSAGGGGGHAGQHNSEEIDEIMRDPSHPETMRYNILAAEEYRHGRLPGQHD